MRRVDLAKHLISAASDGERKRLFAQHPRIVDESLANEIRKACYAAWAVEPVKAQRAAAALRILSKINDKPEIRAAGYWVNGISDITKGKFESAAVSLDNASNVLAKIGRETDGAQAQVAKLLALAMLGRYDEAIRTGKNALKIFVRAGDDLAAGKIEMNLSNIVARQSRHHEAEKYCASARRRFIKAGEKSWQAMAENGLANTYAELNDFTKAESFYHRALAGARQLKILVTEAEIEASLGNLALLRGRYAEALRYLELSRQKYEDLGMPHQSAIADLEIADIYLELNLLNEAVEIYEPVSATFRRLKLRSEEARTRLNFGRAAAKLGKTGVAKNELNKSLRLFELEKNRSGQTSVLLSQAELSIIGRNYDTALSDLKKAALIMRQNDNPRHIISLKLLEGRVFLETGDGVRARTRLSDASELARKRRQTNLLQSALNLLGELSVSMGENAKAKSYFSKAVRIVEAMRSPLDTDEFSMGFLASRLKPFENLARIFLNKNRITDAFNMIERGRSRSLLDAFGKSSGRPQIPLKLQGQMIELRAELNFYYKKLDRSVDADQTQLKADIHRTEAKLAKLNHQINNLSSQKPVIGNKSADRFDMRVLRAQLGDTRTLIEFIETNGNISAFVVTNKKIRFVSGLGTTSEATQALEDLHFQFGALRYGGGQVSRFAEQIKSHADKCLMKIYDQLLRPIETHLSGSRLVIVPVGPLHYVPFHALHNGSRYVAESYETAYAPSTAIWSRLQEKRPKKIRSSLLMGFADERIPLVENEILEIKKILPTATCLVGVKATYAAFTENARNHDLIHLACHGQFRPDNPMFSSLNLADGWIIVRDICAQNIKASLVTLSACETGLNKIFAGDEILGLARGFLSAGASSLVVSLWTVNDDAAGRLMIDFYTEVQRGASVAASLRKAQVDFIGRGEHPYLWSPFIMIG